MRFFWTAIAVVAISSTASANECRIVWLDLFIPQSDVEFEKLSDSSAILTLKNTSKLKSIDFELAIRNGTLEDGTVLEMLFGSRTLVSEGISNDVGVSLQSKSNSWIISFESKTEIRNGDGKVFGGSTVVGGRLICNQMKPWR